MSKQDLTLEVISPRLGKQDSLIQACRASISIDSGVAFRPGGGPAARVRPPSRTRISTTRCGWPSPEQALKLALADGTVLLEIPHIGKLDALAVDEASSTLWAFGKGRLHAYSFAGDVDADDDEEDDNDETSGDGRGLLTLNPNDGSLWLAWQKSLYHFDREAQLREEAKGPHAGSYTR